MSPLQEAGLLLHSIHANGWRKYPAELAILDQFKDTLEFQLVSKKQLSWHAIHGPEQPICPVCNVKPCSWNKASGTEYSSTCGYACSSKQTQMKEEVRQKREATNAERYGGKAPACSNAVKQKRVETLEQRYGPDFNTEVARRQKEGCLKKYGVDNPTKLDAIAEKVKQAHASRTEEQVAETTAKRVVTNLEVHGHTNVGSIDWVVAARAQTNRNRYVNGHHNASHISPASYALLDDVEWLIEQHHVNQLTLSEISQLLNVDVTTVCNRFDVHGIEKRRIANSAGERAIGNALIDMGIDFNANDRTIINPKELDIYIPSHHLAIEYCGLYWHSTAHARITQTYHSAKLRAANAAGVRLLTIFEDEWIHKKDLVLAKIRTILRCNGEAEKVYARRTQVVDASGIKEEFFNTHHVQGDGPSSINLGLQFNDQLVACMGFINQRDAYVLNRYATSCNVPGGFSKLLTHFRKQYPRKQIISFADLRWSEGGVYQTHGFVLDKILPPDYYYVNLSNMTRIHKFNFRHKNLPTILGDQYDPTLSEKENTARAGWHRIYNCGLQRWILD